MNPPMPFWKRLGLVAALALPLLAQGAKDKLVITGASTIAPLAGEIGKRFESKRPGMRIDVQTGGSSRGVADARQGLSDIGMVSRALKDDEKDLLAFPIALDGICMIVHKTNPVAKLDEKQIVEIYTGKITNWKQVGGKDAPITVVNKADGRSTLELFLNYFKLKAPDVKAQVVIGDNQQGIKTVAGSPNSIGYVSIGSAEYEATAGVSIKLLPLGGIAASTETVRSGNFPLSRPLNLVVKTKPDGLTKDFLDFAQSKDVNDIVKDQFFVPMGK